MGLMEKLRSSTKAIFWILILSFGLLWGLADTGAIDSIMLGPRSLGEVNGRTITAEEYNARINAYAQRYQDQMGQAATMEMRTFYEELAWDELVLERIIDSEMERLGIQVTDEEVIEMITGANPHPMVAQFFTREDGSIDRLAMQAAIEAPENTAIWLNIEAQLREQRGREKLNAFIESSLRVTDDEVRREYVRENSTASIQFVRFPFSAVDDAQISVSDSEIRSYFRANREQFQQEQSWRFQFVEFSKDPTAEDTLRIITEVIDLRDEFSRADNDSIFVRQNFSDRPFFGGWVNPSEASWFIADVFTLEDGQVTNPVVHDGVVTIARLTESRAGSEQYTRVRKIQLPFNEANRAAVEASARDIIARANAGELFGDLALNLSAHPSSARGGDLGYISRDDYSTAISNAVFNARPGTITQPLADDNAFLIFEIVDRTNREVRVAQFSRIIEADGGRTIRRMREEAIDFREFADLDGFERESERRGYNVQSGFATKGTPFITGIGQSRVLLSELAKITRANTIPEVIELDERFLVIHVTEVIEAGTRPLDDVRAQIETTLRNEKSRDFTRNRVQQLRASNNTLEALAAADGKEVQTVTTLRMSANTIPGAGREPRVVGAAFGAPVDAVSNVILGDNAAFVILVTERLDATADDIPVSFRLQTQQRLQQEKNQAFQEVWIDRLKEQAEINDFRRFFM
jgi:peptidyl-prolyl cis-trans isomerase D